MRRQLAIVLMATGLLTQASLGAFATTAAHDHSSHPHVDGRPLTPAVLPPEDPALGIVTAGLAAPTSGPCLGMFAVVDDGPTRCTHGPDAAPAGVDDVRSAEMSDAEAREMVESAPDFVCDGDGDEGRRAHAIYAHAPDVTDRFAAKQALFKAIIAEVQEQYRDSTVAHGGSDELIFRFTHTTPIGDDCEPLLDSVNLPANGDDDTFSATVDALEAMGYTDSNRRYLVFVDATKLCGIGHIWGDDSPNPATNLNNRLGPALFSRVDAGCWGYAETHELTHNIGGVQNSAPNTSGGYHCNDDYDVMCYADGGASSSMFVRCSPSSVWEDRLDCGGDDYFNPAPASGSYLANNWNTADSGYLFTPNSGGGSGDGGDGGGGGPSTPNVWITTPTAGASVAAPVNLRGTASDADGDLDRVVIKVDGTAVKTLRPRGSTWSTAITADLGTETITAVAYDDGGRTRSVSRTFSVVPPDLFTDDDSSTFERSINTIAFHGVTKGCNPPRNDLYCPNAGVTRGQMAAFLARALSLPSGGPSFRDTGGSPFASDISRLAKAGITKGCNPPANTRFCPNAVVTRGEMAAFMARALSLPSGGPSFRDTGGSPFTNDISRLAKAGITRGCNPPANTRFCPSDRITRGQMAAFMTRALYS